MFSQASVILSLNRGEVTPNASWDRSHGHGGRVGDLVLGEVDVSPWTRLPHHWTRPTPLPPPDKTNPLDETTSPPPFGNWGQCAGDTHPTGNSCLKKCVIFVFRGVSSMILILRLYYNYLIYLLSLDFWDMMVPLSYSQKRLSNKMLSVPTLNINHKILGFGSLSLAVY